MQIEVASTQDLPELLDLLYGIFLAGNPEHPRFEALYPDLFVETEAAAQRHLIIRQKDRIVSCIGTYPMTLAIAGCRVAVAGLGQVCTDPSMKGRGCMSQLLTASVERMEREGIAVSWLAGRHDRYGRFGWETVASGLTYSFVGSATRTTDASLLVAQSAHREATLTDAMIALRNSTTTVEDTPENYAIRMHRNLGEVWVAHTLKSEAPVAWAVVFPNNRRIGDFYGSIDGILQLVRSAALKLGSVQITVSPAEQGLSEKLRSECAQMSFGASSLLVVSLKKVLENYAPLLQKRMPPGFGVTLRMQLPNGSYEEADIGSSGKIVELDRKRMARLLFGPERATSIPGVPEDLYELNTLFPLPFTLPELFHV